MPTIDMPLEKLRAFEGVNPCPSDMDPFWDNALAEMRAMDPQIELKPAAFQVPFVECFDLYFTGVGGARVYAKYLRPKNIATPHPAVLQFHGYSSNSGNWSSKLSYVAAGFSVASLDCRGQGGWSEDSGSVTGNTLRGHIIRGLHDALDGHPENLLFHKMFLDTAQLANIVMGFDEVDETRVGAEGGSQGGGLTLACASLEPRIKRAAPVHPFLCDYQRVWNMDLDVGAYEELRTWFRYFDPEHKRETEVWNALGYIDNQHLAKRIKAEVLMCTGLMDSTCPPSTQFAAYNKITSQKEMIVWPDYKHERPREAGDQIFQFMMGL